MKKLLTTLFAFCALTAVLSAAPRIYNPGFEEPGKGWKHTSEYSMVEKAGINNSRALYINRVKTVQRSSWAWQFTRVEGGKKYRISCQIKANITKKGNYKVGAGFTLTLRQDFKIVKNFYPICCYESTNGEWKLVKYEFTAPEGVNSCQISIGLYDGFFGEAWFDDVKIEELP